MNTVRYATIDKNLPVTDFTNYMGKQYAGDPTRVPRESATDLIRSLKSQSPIARGNGTILEDVWQLDVKLEGTQGAAQVVPEVEELLLQI